MTQTSPEDAILNDPVLVAFATGLLTRLPSWVQEVETRIGTLRPMEDSRVQGDDKVKWIDPPSQQITHLLHSAHDHLTMLAQSIETTGPRPLAGFSLIRVAIEASALASWIMIPGTIDARVRKSIRLTWDNRQRVAVYTKRYDTPTDAITAELRRILTEITQSRPGLKSLDLEAPFAHLTDIISAVDDKIPGSKRSNLRGVDAWRACSGIAHSNPNFAAGALQRTENEDHVLVTVNVTALGMMLEQATRHLGYALDLAEDYMLNTTKKR
ncbi:hypothetical protein IT072_15410 [Leifsonia sp. ZF2019]|uniref:hypothetical protein n=1 Tax=Leifsonia sp. ZF2019 TaxID=2781978 RepID=UPI001CBAFFDE|nr:hypothetical protein [Leifsonia sp. ZF2019]UAJ78616.1 hypothetical protein IT072_15410 [Leifsonia sp. ZF2019]